MATTPLRIGFNGRPFIVDGMRGLSRHTFELIRELKRQHPDVEIFVYSYDAVSSFYKRQLPFVTFRDRRVRPKLLWDLLLLPREIRADRLDLFHSTINLGVPLISKRFPLYATLHDHFTHAARLPWGKRPREWWAALNYRLELRLLKRAKLFFTVSHAAKADIARSMNLPAAKIKVAYNGVNLSTTDPRVVGNYFLYVGGLEVRKSVITLLRAMVLLSERTPVKLILAGSLRAATPEVRKLLEERRDLFELREGVSDEELTKLYRNARALVFPSLEEGFGLPLVEAMALGCPVIASDIEVFKEIGTGASLFFKAGDDRDLLRCLTEFEANPSLGERLSQAGPRAAAKFTWAKMAEEVYSSYVKD